MMKWLVYWILPMVCHITMLAARMPDCRSSNQYDNLEMPVYEMNGNYTVWTPCYYPNPRSTVSTCRKLNPCQLPDPRLKWKECGRKVKSWICDPDGLLTTQQADHLDEILSQDAWCSCEEKCTKKYRGSPVVLLLAKYLHMVDTSGLVCSGGDCGEMYPQLDPSHHAETDSDVEYSLGNFTELVLSRWELGLCQDDMVVLYDAQHKQFSVAAGARAYEKLGDVYGRAVSDALVHLTTSDLYPVLEELVEAYTNTLFPKHSVAFVTAIYITCAVILFIVLIVVVAVVIYKKSTAGRSSGKHHMVPVAERA